MEKEQLYLSDSNIQKMAKRAEKSQGAKNVSYEEKNQIRRYRKKRPLSPNGKI